MNTSEKIKSFFNVNVKESKVENTYIPKIKIQSTVDCGKGLSFNEKAQHIFGLIKQMK
jgi:hypothetical protein